MTTLRRVLDWWYRRGGKPKPYPLPPRWVRAACSIAETACLVGILGIMFWLGWQCGAKHGCPQRHELRKLERERREFELENEDFRAMLGIERRRIDERDDIIIDLPASLEATKKTPVMPATDELGRNPPKVKK